MDNSLTKSRLRMCDAVFGIDEVGRGAWAGPVTVGVVRVGDPNSRTVKGLNDSKKLSKVRREDLYANCLDYADDVVVVDVPPSFIDVYGLTTSLQEAARRGVAELTRPSDRDVMVLLDGTYNYLTTPSSFPLSLLTPLPATVNYTIHVEAKLDGKDSTVAAAALLAKVSRDANMAELDVDGLWGWAKNSGYGVASHVEAVKKFGLHPVLHRKRMKQWERLGFTVDVPRSELNRTNPSPPPLTDIVVKHPKVNPVVVN